MCSCGVLVCVCLLLCVLCIVLCSVIVIVSCVEYVSFCSLFFVLVSEWKQHVSIIISTGTSINIDASASANISANNNINIRKRELTNVVVGSCLEALRVGLDDSRLRRIGFFRYALDCARRLNPIPRATVTGTSISMSTNITTSRCTNRAASPASNSVTRRVADPSHPFDESCASYRNP